MLDLPVEMTIGKNPGQSRLSSSLFYSPVRLKVEANIYCVNPHRAKRRAEEEQKKWLLSSAVVSQISRAFSRSLQFSVHHDRTAFCRVVAPTLVTVCFSLYAASVHDVVFGSRADDT